MNGAQSICRTTKVSSITGQYDRAKTCFAKCGCNSVLFRGDGDFLKRLDGALKVNTAGAFDEHNVAGPKGLLKPTAGGFRIRQEKRAYS